MQGGFQVDNGICQEVEMPECSLKMEGLTVMLIVTVIGLEEIGRQSFMFFIHLATNVLIQMVVDWEWYV